MLFTTTGKLAMHSTTANRRPSELRAAFAALAIVATAATPVVAFAGAAELPTTTVSVEPTHSPQSGCSYSDDFDYTSPDSGGDS